MLNEVKQISQSHLLSRAMKGNETMGSVKRKKNCQVSDIFYFYTSGPVDFFCSTQSYTAFLTVEPVLCHVQPRAPAKVTQHNATQVFHQRGLLEEVVLKKKKSTKLKLCK